MFLIETFFLENISFSETDLQFPNSIYWFLWNLPRVCEFQPSQCKSTFRRYLAHTFFYFTQHMLLSNMWKIEKWHFYFLMIHRYKMCCLVQIPIWSYVNSHIETPESGHIYLFVGPHFWWQFSDLHNINLKNRNFRNLFILKSISNLLISVDLKTWLVEPRYNLASRG